MLITRNILLPLSAGLSISASTVHALSTDQTVFAPLPDTDLSASKPRPLVIWHGLGDTALSDGISSFIDDIKSLYPGIFVHSVQIPEGGSPDDERKAGFYGNARDQASSGCDQLLSIPEIADSKGFDAMGFSQGGLFLRWYAQYCVSSDAPSIKNLLTFGTPHYGISALIPCPTPPTLTCLLAARAARAGIYTPWAQSHLVQAAYFRDPARIDEFLQYNTFIRDLNGEGRLANETYMELLTEDKESGGRGLNGLENLVAVQFDADRTVSPAQSAHFATYSPENKTVIIPMETQQMYQNDWIGLKTLDERGGLVLEHCPGEHMDLDSGDCAMRLIKEWIGWSA